MRFPSRYFLVPVLLSSIPGLAADPPTIPITQPLSSAHQSSSSADVLQALSQMQQLIRAQSAELAEQRLAINEQKRELDAVRLQLLAAQPTGGPSSGTNTAETSVPKQNLTDQSVGDQQPSQQDEATSAAALRSATEELAVYHPVRLALYPTEAVLRTPLLPQLNPAGPDSSAPLSLQIGKAKFTPGGWVDFTSIYRTTDVGSGLGTSFQSIPYNNTVAGGLSENRFTAQSSRLSLRADESIGHDKIFGYVEADFNGALASNGFVSTNSDSFRMRVYFLNFTHRKLDVLGGQSWSLLTPNRKGMSPFLSEIFNTTHLDTNYQVGLTYARQTQLRAIYHFNQGLAFGLSLENPEQFSGSAATFPSLFSTTETDINSSTSAGGGTSTPNLHPDVIAKIAGDKVVGGRNFHVEVVGLLTSARVFTPASVTKGAKATDSREGGGVAANANFAVMPRLHLILDSYWSDGGGRYIGGVGPGFVVAQRGAVTAPFSVQLVHSGSGIGGFEWQADKGTVLSAYYGGAYFQRVSSLDPNIKTPTLVGYGFAGSANSNNRAIQEGSFATVTTLWKSEQYGALQIVTQSSYVTRAPWFVAPPTQSMAAPKDAHTFME
ncbi:MAG TPA: hypothetical protein VGD64_10595, partial [Acidisarcina sp.]